MDVNILRALLTAACFLVFMAIVMWAWSGARRDRFAEAARLPLDEDERLEPHFDRDDGAGRSA
jgi:cytochrome c oxidase cbb3-type subunit IV